MAGQDKVGFEPTVHNSTTAFKTVALDHSATCPVQPPSHPKLQFYLLMDDKVINDKIKKSDFKKKML
jgi:hypothetical protein